MHAAVAGLKASAGHAPLDPVQLSATSHWPAEARQTVVGDLKTSSQAVALVPEQWSAASSSHAPPCEAPVHAAVAGLKLFAGQALLVPSQLSGTSHWPAEGRHSVPAATLASAGQATLEPEQLSATSQTPAEARHSKLLGLKASVGQAELEPVQVSATSQTPAEARQTVPALPAGCVQATLLPSQISRVQALPSSVQVVPAGFLMSDGQVALLPVQVSATSHSSAAARQTAPALPGAC